MTCMLFYKNIKWTCCSNEYNLRGTVLLQDQNVGHLRSRVCCIFLAIYGVTERAPVPSVSGSGPANGGCRLGHSDRLRWEQTAAHSVDEKGGGSELGIYYTGKIHQVELIMQIQRSVITPPLGIIYITTILLITFCRVMAFRSRRVRRWICWRMLTMWKCLVLPTWLASDQVSSLNLP